MRRSFGLVLFLVFYGSIVALTHFYFVLRLVLIPQLPSPFSEILVVAFVALAALLIVRPLADRMFPHEVVDLLSWPAFTWMGAMWILLMCWIGWDIGLSVVQNAGVLLGVSASRLAFSEREQAAIVSLLALGLSLAASWLALRDPPIRRVVLALEHWPQALEGFRIVQLSDVHIGPLRRRRFASRLVERANALAPDLVAITGDLVDGSVEHLGPELDPMRDFRARHGVFFVTGNHDYYSRVDPWVAKVREIGFHVLRNELVTIGVDGASFQLAGVEDRLARNAGHPEGEDLGRALANRSPERPVVLLAHNPAVFDEAAGQGVDLQLSGHTHGGQIWPFRWIVRLVTPYVAGRYRKGGSQLYVSRGTGFWGPPMRLFRSGEITELTLTRAALDRDPVPGFS